ncbi:MAG: AtpZ/AtpI family protein [Phycisphaerae bacterium]|jgi:F0F1-type ATP synthase assembly protein I
MPKNKKAKRQSPYVWYSIGLEFAVTMGLGAFFGSLLDRIQSTQPGFIIIGALGGFAFQLYIVLKRDKAEQEADEDEKKNGK